MRIARSACLVSLWVVACGGAPTPTPPASPAQVTGDAPPTAAPPTAAPPAAAPPVPSERAREAEGAPASSSPRAADTAESEPNQTREVTYLVVPEGLRITVAGVKFTVSATATQIASGWGAKLSVVASAVDGKPHSLGNPKGGPLAFAGAVQRKGHPEPDHFGDERAGDGELGVFGDDVTRFSRTWPPKGTRVLGSGDALDLQVALWGLGLEKEERRPVKQFCHVRMLVDKGKPRAIVEPPPSVRSK